MTDNRMRVGVVGAGYVGLTTAVCLAERGIDTVCVDVDGAKVDLLSAGTATIDEPDLQDVLRAGLNGRLLRFATDYAHLADRDAVFVCVPTPGGPDGSADLRAVHGAVGALAAVLRAGAVVVMKSTVPVGTTRDLAERLRDKAIGVVSAPEFLREGHAVHDFRRPDRLIIGALRDVEFETVRQAYGPQNAPTMRMSPESAELAKYASNAFLAIKLSYTNSLAALCARVGADIADVTRCMGADERIGASFLRPGPGWGGSCLPKDTAALLSTGRANGVPLPEVQACRVTNAGQPSRLVSLLQRRLPRPLRAARITALGLTFKSDTADTRDSPALAVCARLAAEGAQVCGYDPALKSIDPAVLASANVTVVDDPYRAAKAADAIVVLTEWPEFAGLDWSAIADEAPGALAVDTRNILDSKALERAGLVYLGNGRPTGF